jgi:transcriptional regulator with XRE-family HTH domain
MTVSEQIKKEMESQNIDPIELSRRMGYSFQYIYDLFKGRRRWNETTITKACKALGLEISIIKTSGIENLSPTGTDN